MEIFAFFKCYHRQQTADFLQFKHWNHLCIIGPMYLQFYMIFMKYLFDQCNVAVYKVFFRNHFTPLCSDSAWFLYEPCFSNYWRVSSMYYNATKLLLMIDSWGKNVKTYHLIFCCFVKLQFSFSKNTTQIWRNIPVDLFFT